MVEGVKHLARRRAAARAGVQAVYRGLYGVLTLAALLLYSRYFGKGEQAAPVNGGSGMVVIAGAGGARARRGRHAGCRAPAGHQPVAGDRPGLRGRRRGYHLRPAVRQVHVARGRVPRDVGSQSMKIIVDTTMQHEVDDIYRGRVFSVNDTAFNLLFVAACSPRR